MTEALRLEDWIDCSNWSRVPTPAQVQSIRDQGYVGVIMGLQDNPLHAPFCADRQKEMFSPGFWQEFYVDLPGRRLDLCSPNSICWVDIEDGCFQNRYDVRQEVDRIQQAGLRPGIYTNQGGMAALGMTDEFGYLPLWYANPSLINFQPFCGWTSMLMWQRTSTTTIAGFTVDLNKRLVPDPTPPPPPIPHPLPTHILTIYSDGSYTVNP